MKTYLSFLLFSLPLLTIAQYTDVINSNRPGVSQSAYAVGHNVVQLEAGPYYTSENHTPLEYDVKGFGVDFAGRYGLLWEPLEIMINGTFQRDKYSDNRSAISQDYTRSNFKNLTLGAKYLIYDPHKNAVEEKPNLYSWKANRKFKWSRLIPAVSVFAGANYDTEDNPYTAPGVEGVSAKVVLITQHNFSNGWVFVMNFMGDRIGSDDFSQQYIFTLTHGFNEKWVAFGEYQAINSDFYADDLFRLGGAYLLSKNLQLDTAITFNTKDTPSVFNVNFGASYRLDFHKDQDPEENGTSAEQEAERRNNKNQDFEDNNSSSDFLIPED
ncbi:transporter [Formosa sp. A9]|uniref:transporter n=1 Tax=Formosa sp. A9 TaxID=3442641 RepID=UPI003EBB2EEA